MTQLCHIEVGEGEWAWNGNDIYLWVRQRAELLLFSTQSQAEEECREDEAGCIHANGVWAKAKAGVQGGGASPAWGTGSVWWSLGKLGTAQEAGSLSSDWWGSVAGRVTKQEAAGRAELLKVEPEHKPRRFPWGSTKHGLSPDSSSVWRHNQRSIFKHFMLLNGHETPPEW